jgi:GNAT superfamily N-acetyltransferase
LTSRIVAIPEGEGRLALLPILLAADDAEDHVRVHLDDGHVFALVQDGTVVGAVQAVPRDEVAGRVELTLVAVAEVHRAKGVGKRLVAGTLDELRRLGFLRAVVGTSNAGIAQIAFYQRCGFRMLSIERDHFDAARGYAGTESEGGIVHRDLVWFDQPLA